MSETTTEAQRLPTMSDGDEAFRVAAMKLIQDRGFRADIDVLSESVLAQIEEICTRHMPTLLACGWKPDQVDHLIAMLSGWILGFSLDDHETVEQHQDAVFKRLLIATVAAGWSSANSEHIHAKSKH